MKKLIIPTVSFLLAAASAFAWSKKSENLGNLGRMYVSIGGGLNTSKVSAVGAGEKTFTGASGVFSVNAPVFKPGVNAFRKIKWAGVDASMFFNYDYSGKADMGGITGISNTGCTLGAALTPYLNLETGLDVFKAIKPFGIAYAGYKWDNYDDDNTSLSDNYFVYGVGGGVEFVIIDELCFTPALKWNGNAQDNQPTYFSISADLSYWFSNQFCFAFYWEHNLGADYETYDVKHGDIFGVKFRLGFIR